LTSKEFAKEPRSCKRTDRNSERSHLLLKVLTFLQKTSKEFAKEPRSCKKTDRNSERSHLLLKSTHVPAKNIEGICKGATFLQKN
jgi:hypothetical protein